MKKLSLLLPLLLVGSFAYGRQAAAPATDEKQASEKQADERRFVGEVVAVDVSGKTLTIKASQIDAKGERVEKTMTLPVEEPAVKQLESITTGDKVTVLWHKDEASQRDTVVKVSKGESAKDETTPPKDQ
jgi:Cu/Ag efflux protein CusF